MFINKIRKKLNTYGKNCTQKNRKLDYKYCVYMNRSRDRDMVDENIILFKYAKLFSSTQHDLYEAGHS